MKGFIYKGVKCTQHSTHLPTRWLGDCSVSNNVLHFTPSVFHFSSIRTRDGEKLCQSANVSQWVVEKGGSDKEKNKAWSHKKFPDLITSQISQYKKGYFVSKTIVASEFDKKKE